MPLYVCRRWEGPVTARKHSGSPGSSQTGSGLSDAPRGRAAHRAPDGAAVTWLPKRTDGSRCDVRPNIRRLHHENGTTAIEYAMIAAGIAAAIVVAVIARLVGQEVSLVVRSLDHPPAFLLPIFPWRRAHRRAASGRARLERLLLAFMRRPA